MQWRPRTHPLTAPIDDDDLDRLGYFLILHILINSICSGQVHVRHRRHVRTPRRAAKQLQSLASCASSRRTLGRRCPVAQCVRARSFAVRRYEQIESEPAVPERMTRSLTSSPLAPKLASRVVKLFDGDGSPASASAARDVTPSRRPSCTSHRSRPNCSDTASRAASATMSAHDTVPGHTASSTAFAVSITSYPPSDAFGAASFSADPAPPGDESSRTDASQPCRFRSSDRFSESDAGGRRMLGRRRQLSPTTIASFLLISYYIP